ncbi:hypothetical protein ACFFNY_35460 [Paenibacillus hodogayensis]|uniref:Uncharacterized protein n=1 Tax=Paenibacillus hodogayensis TaxID=279208 RepID=A0ABV5W8K2_9BACL
MNWKNHATAVVVALLLFALAALPAEAASYELPVTHKTAFDKMTEAAGSALKAKLSKQYADFLALQQQDQNRDQEMKTLQQANNDALDDVRRQIKLIDAEPIERLRKQAESTKERYKPLLEMYTAVNQQIAAFKPLKNKELNTMLSLQAASMKVPVQLAKQDIKAKESALQTAKASATAKQKKVRDALEAIEPLKDKIKTEKASASRVKKWLDEDWKTFKPIVKQGDAAGSAQSLTTLLSRLGQIVSHKQAVCELEKKIGTVIAKAKTQIP